MCGIIGLFRPAPAAAPPGPERVMAARDRMAHRGPDGSGLFQAAGGRLVLGHRRLAIIDPSPAGAQPMTDADAGLTVVFNGEIYNYRELRRELMAQGVTFRSQSDTEVLLRLYDRHGVDGLARLNGMFAFALWDDRRQGLLLARDGLGIKPLYVFDDGETTGFASECRALAALLPERSASRADPAARLGFFMYGWVPEPFSPWAAIEMLPAGTWLWTDDQGTSRGRFFDVVDEIVAAEMDARTATPKSRREWLASLRDDVAASVNRHLVADTPVSLFLSAGVDSTMIAELAASATGGVAGVTLTADRFIGSDDDEAPGAAATAAACGMPHHVRHLTAADFTDQRDALLRSMDVPTIDGVNVFFAAAAAADAGFKVALSGVGGDEMLGGYPSFRQIPPLMRLLGPVARIPLLGPALGRGLRRMTAPWLGAFTSLKYASLLECAGADADAYLLRRGLFLPWELERGEDARSLAETLARVRRAAGGDGRYARIASPYLRVLAMETELYMRGQLLRDADWAGMASSVEIRTPLADAALFRRAIRAIAAMTPPPDKWTLSVAIGPQSAAAATRPKTGFSLPIRDWPTASSTTGPVRKPRGLRGWAQFVYDSWNRENGMG